MNVFIYPWRLMYHLRRLSFRFFPHYFARPAYFLSIDDCTTYESFHGIVRLSSKSRANRQLISAFIRQGLSDERKKQRDRQISSRKYLSLFACQFVVSLFLSLSLLLPIWMTFPQNVACIARVRKFESDQPVSFRSTNYKSSIFSAIHSTLLPLASFCYFTTAHSIQCRIIGLAWSKTNKQESTQRQNYGRLHGIVNVQRQFTCSHVKVRQKNGYAFHLGQSKHEACFLYSPRISFMAFRSFPCHACKSG